MTRSRWTLAQGRDLLRLRRSTLEPLEARRMLALVGAQDIAAAVATLSFRDSEARVQIATGDGAVNDNGAELNQSTSQIGLDLFRNDPLFAGIDGDGYSIAVLDTGADLDHPAFGPDANGDGRADRIVYSWDFADQDPDAGDLNGHGTNVASIAAGANGLAPGANIIVLKVVDDAGFGIFGDVEAALQWVVANVANYNIAAVNMSLSDNTNRTTPTGDYGLDDELAALNTLGVVTASAAGNFYGPSSGQGVGYPGADPNSLAIGATWDGNNGGPQNWSSGSIDFTTGPDRITSFSQRHATLTDLFAPGAWITAAGLNGGNSTFAGTSQATPHVAGAVLLLQQLAQRELGRLLTPAEVRDELAHAGRSIIDGDDEDDNVPNTGLTFSELNVYSMGQDIVTQGTIHVASSSPAAGAIVSSPPTSYVIHFSEPPSLSTLSAPDLKVNGLPASTVQMLDAVTADFRFNTSPVTSQGVQHLDMAAGAVKNAAGKDLAPFSTLFRYDALRMQLTASTPTNGQTSALPLTELRFTFNESIDAASLQPFDLWIDRGLVTSAQLVGGTTLVFGVSGLTSEGPVAWNLAAGSVSDAYNNPSLAASGNFTLDVDQLAIDAPQVVPPLGGLTFSSARSGLIQTTSDVDRYLAPLEAGQRLTVLAKASALLRTAIDVYTPSGVLAATLVAATPGAEVVVDSFAAVTSGAYTVALRGQSGTQGNYDLQLWINATLEAELHGGVMNDQLGGAQTLDSVLVNLPVGASGATVLGTTDAEVTKLGPDGFGYEAVVVPFEFVDISTTGASLMSFGADNWWVKLSTSQLAGFNFGFYGKNYSELYLDSNGHITFDLQDSNPSNTDLTLNPFMATIAPLWDDLVLGAAAPSGVFFQVLGTGANQQLVLQWNEVRFNGANDTITFQVVLNESNGAIQFNYLDLDSANPASGGARATVGIKDVDFQVPPQGLHRLLVAYNSGPNDFVGTGKSVRIAVGTTTVVTPDLYAINLVAGQATTFAVSPREYGSVDLALLNSAGVLVANSTGGTDPGRVIPDFKALVTGRYYIRVSGSAGVDYSLQVTRAATQEVETNDAAAFAQSITATGVVSGTIGYGFEPPTAAGAARPAAFDVLGSPVAIGFSTLGSFGGPTKGIAYAGIEVLKVGTLVSTYTVSLNGTNYTNGSGSTQMSAFPVSLTEYAAGELHSVQIVGNVLPGVTFERWVTWNEGDAHAMVTTRLTNLSGAALTNVALLENQDPDPGKVQITLNDVSTSGDLVTAWSSAGSVALGSLDPRAVVSAEGFINVNPFDILDSPNDPNDTTADIAINLAFRYGTLAVGASVESTFAIVLGGTPSMTAATFDAVALQTLPSSDDFYSIPVVAGNSLSLSTLTPGGASSGINALDPRIDLYSPTGALLASNDNGASDARNAKLAYTATQTGVYTLRVQAVGDTRGSYQLVARGYTGAGAPSMANLAPTASAGGPYNIPEGQGVTFDASTSFDPDANDALVYRWDLDGDGAFDDGTGLKLTRTWSQLLALGVDGSATPWKIRVQVDDGQGHLSASPDAWLSVANAAPTVSMVAPTSTVVRAFSEGFRFVATDASPGDTAAGFLYQVDWNGDGQFDQTVTGAAQVTAPWTYTSKGAQTVRVRAIDRDGGISQEAVYTIDVQPWAIVTDTAGQAVLKIGGTPGDDIIVVSDLFGGTSGSVVATLWTPQENRIAAFALQGYVQIAGGDGNDRILASGLSARAAILQGDGGNDLLVGGAGNDVLMGGAGNDLVIGGRGSDFLTGDDGEDLLIAGRTTFDLDFTALSALRDEWTSGRSYSQRVANLTGTGTGPRANGNYFLTPGATVFDDAGSDQLGGGSGNDWFWYDAFEDALLDLIAGELTQDLHLYPDGGHPGGGGQSL